jgi:hypothetical protein
VNGFHISGWRHSIDVSEGVGFDAEPQEVGPRELEIDLVASVIDVCDFEWGTGTWDGDFVADAGTMGASGAAGFLRGLAMTPTA